MSNKLVGVVLAAVVAVVGISVNAAGNGQEKVLMCHNNNVTIEIGAPAVEAHMNHGDVPGACDDNGGGPQ